MLPYDVAFATSQGIRLGRTTPPLIHAAERTCAQGTRFFNVLCERFTLHSLQICDFLRSGVRITSMESLSATGAVKSSARGVVPRQRLFTYMCTNALELICSCNLFAFAATVFLFFEHFVEGIKEFMKQSFSL